MLDTSAQPCGFVEARPHDGEEQSSASIQLSLCKHKVAQEDMYILLMSEQLNEYTTANADSALDAYY